jgi:AAA family ATP:ADP antiporter
MSLSDSSKQLSKTSIRNIIDYIWPIERRELPKFLSITLLMFCILLIQNLIRAQKDSIVNTMIGTETISFLKLWGVLPASILMTIIYVKLVNTMRAENIFYLIISIFLLFFALFGFVLFPYHETFHLNPESTQAWVAAYPHFKWFILLFSKWSFSLFYIIAELWPNAVFAILFWQFVNNVTSIEESKRFYLLFGLFGQTGLYFAGAFLENLPQMSSYVMTHYGVESTASILSVQLTLGFTLALGALAMITFWALNHKVLDKTASEIKFTAKKKKGLPLGESFKMILSSRYIMLIAILLTCYGMSVNLVEQPWKAKATSLYTTNEEYAVFVGGYLKYTGIVTMTFALLGSSIVRKFGWFAAAIITPAILFTTGMIFFAISSFEGMSALMVSLMAVSDPVAIAVSMGFLTQVCAKSSKYTLFDATKEMAYVPLSDELKAKGKGAVDMIGNKLGKSTGSLLQFMIFMLIPSATYQSISGYLMVVFTIICIVWIWAVGELSIEYKKAVEEKGGE